MATPHLSVVIPCFNHGAYLPEVLRSIESAKRNDVEVIIVDDGSTDTLTCEVIAGLDRNRITIIRQQNAGVAAARNAGFRAAKADIFLPVDADNRIRPAYIEQGIALLSADPDVGVVYGDAEYFGARTGRWKTGKFDLERLLEWNYIDACAVLRREVWEQNGGYDEAMPRMGLEDWDMWLGAVSRDWKFAYVPEVLFDYRVVPGSMISKANPGSHETERYVAAKHGYLYRKAWQRMKDERWPAKAKVLGRKLRGGVKENSDGGPASAGELAIS
ncbi:MAG TPA: glycosyltransferase [Opitutaceae bacterium]|nr:glycosyltransferase [Opitutaceae bacterium]